MILLRRVLTQSVAALGVLAALAVLDVGPRAAAAYQPAAGAMAPARTGLDTAAAPDGIPDAPPAAPDDRKPHDPTGKPSYGFQQPASGGSMSSQGSAGTGNSPPTGCLPVADLPPPNLVVYFRQPEATFDLTVFIESLLDPPRRA